MLTDTEIPALLDTSSADLIADFFLPMLSHSVRYDRGVGYFSSGWLWVAASGMNKSLLFSPDAGIAQVR